MSSRPLANRTRPTVGDWPLRLGARHRLRAWRATVVSLLTLLAVAATAMIAVLALSLLVSLSSPTPPRCGESYARRGSALELTRDLVDELVPVGISITAREPRLEKIYQRERRWRGFTGAAGVPSRAG